jgi:3-hydroxyisobutyrate dehydrogenase-like beta-hydroxyacid dehydrogenase
LGFVGLGSMGSPMAKRLVGAGFELKVFDVLDERTHPLIELGAVSAASLVEAAKDTEALVLMVANAEQAEGVLFGEGVHIAAAAEALAYAEALGLDPRFVFEAIRHGAANSFMLQDRGERMLKEEFVPPKSALDIFVKDMGLVRKAAEERGLEVIPTPTASLSDSTGQ